MSLAKFHCLAREKSNKNKKYKQVCMQVNHVFMFIKHVVCSRIRNVCEEDAMCLLQSQPSESVKSRHGSTETMKFSLFLINNIKFRLLFSQTLFSCQNSIIKQMEQNFCSIRYIRRVETSLPIMIGGIKSIVL